MAKTIEQMKAQSAEVKNATVVGENTATRVGTLFTDIVEHVEQYETEQTADTEANTLAISNEAQARAKADEGLNDSIVTEVARAKAAEQANAQAIDAAVGKNEEQDQKLSELTNNVGIVNGESQLIEVGLTFEDGYYYFNTNENRVESISSDGKRVKVQVQKGVYVVYGKSKGIRGCFLADAYGYNIIKYVDKQTKYEYTCFYVLKEGLVLYLSCAPKEIISLYYSETDKVIINELERVENETKSNADAIASITDTLKGIDITSSSIASVSSDTYKMIKCAVSSGEKFQLRINCSAFNRIIVCYNLVNENRLIDTSNPSDANVWKEYIAPADIEYLGIGFLNANENSASLSFKINGVEQMVSDNKQDIEDLKSIVHGDSVVLPLRNPITYNGSSSSNNNVSVNLNGATKLFVSSYVDNNNRNMLTILDEGGNVIKDYTQGQGTLNTKTMAYELTLDLPSNAKYYKAGRYNFNGIVNPSNLYVELYKNIERLNDKLSGLKWTACGDSFTEGDFSNGTDPNIKFEDGAYVGCNKVYPYYIGQRTHCVVNNEAKCGSPMTYINGKYNEFSAPNGRYMQIPSDADIITLKFGINDFNYSVPVGNISDNTNTTFYGAWNIVLNHIIRTHPNAKIGIIVTNGSSITYTMAIRAVAKKFGIPVLDMEADYSIPYLIRQNERTDIDAEIKNFLDTHNAVNWGQNNHPNAQCHEKESWFIEEWLKKM